MPFRLISLSSLSPVAAVVVAATLAIVVKILAIFQGNGSSTAYLIAAITALVAVIGALARYVQKQTSTNQEFFSKQLEQSSENLKSERTSRTEETKAFIGQLDSLARQTREAHEREMNQVLTRLEQSDKIATRQTEILSELPRRKR